MSGGVNVSAVWAHKKIGRRLWLQNKLETYWSDLLHMESKSCFILFWLDKYLWVHYEVTPTDMGCRDSRCLFSSFSSFSSCCLLLEPPSSFSRVFNIKVWSLTGLSLKQGLFCWLSLRPARNDKNLSTLVQLEKKMKRGEKGQDKIGSYKRDYLGVWQRVWNWIT